MKLIKSDSIKLRITLWYALFIVLTIAVMMGVLLISQSLSSQDYYDDQLRQTIDQAASSIVTAEDIHNVVRSTDLGVHVTVLDENGELILGRRNFNLVLKEETMRIRRTNDGDFWYVMDKPIELNDGTQLWLRCFISSRASERHTDTIMVFLLIAIPLLLLVAIFGGFALTKRAFEPLDKIIHTAEGISASTDLKQRFRLDGQEDEVGRLADTFDGMLGRLEKSLEDEKTFISDASHELRTPISVIRAQSEFALCPGRTPEEKDAALEIILKRSTKAGQMLSQMLLLSRMDTDKLPLNPEQINLSELLGQIAQEMQFRAEEKGIAIQLDIVGNVWCWCDELMIIRMVTNLLENAIQYGRQNGHIWLNLSCRDGVVEISVRDDGVGISVLDQSKIWQRFYQVNKSGERSQGFGLGLSIVKWIVSAHNGKISVTSTLGKGSCFVVELPCCQA